MKVTPEYIVAGLVKRGVPEHVARGVTRNFQDESGLESGIQEKNPRGGRGGFGFAQWTGPRRIALEDYARSRGVAPDDPEMQLDNFMRENAGEEAGAWKAVLNSANEQEAAVNFVNKWERPASENARARTARYQGDSPSEGGARFGGTGLGDPANPVTITPPTAGATPAKAAEDTRPMWQKLIGNLAEGGGAAGSGNVATPVPELPGPPRAALAAQQGMATLDPQQGLIQRQKLAEAMARLNSGKTWV